MERSTFCWYFDGTDAKARQIAGTGASVAYVKAGGDQGVVWIPGADMAGFAQPQWDEGYLRPLTAAGLAAYPFFYNWPGEPDKAAVVTALAHRPAPVVVLNPEAEWRVQSPHSPYNTLGEANAYAVAWVNDLRRRLPAGTRIGYSTCPSWADFPAEGFDAACDFSLPQDYWDDNQMAPDGETGAEAGEDMIEAHLRRCGTAKPCVAVLTACGEMSDAGIVARAQDALSDYPGIAGFCSWEAGNSAWQADAMRRAYALLPADKVVEEPPAPRPTLAGAVIAYLEAAWHK